MIFADLFNGDRMYFSIAVAVFGAILGSFLNVVIYRLPKILHRQWIGDATELLTEEGLKVSGSAKQKVADDFGLVLPRSACPHCQTPIPAWHNIPIISYLLLRGKCSHCKARISVRYPLVELLTALAFGFSAWQFGFDYLTFGALVFTGLLIAMSGIDWDQKLLPDQLTYSLLWAGLLFNINNGFVPLPAAIIGAVAGYLSLWSVYWAFKILTGKEGMGYGDFKLLAALGAWLGWQQLPLIIILSAVAGLVIGGGMMLLSKDKDRQIPFGPYLAIAGWVSMFFGPNIVGAYLRASGLS
ncbi:prepilin peptidase [Permianibacter aggregans]|uniref:Prepilin leader peptidase/N-methyltransferase n=1 Tax=Permianibacter aggregans TaxID=1510150 RepID=A0A4R6UI28_9GAMM|nr:A24 family peptidase [Permianibacter aggregans]QGX39017.1 prepilin peptidase [Permianibacter aggregans]TDQ44645.1 type 4 prepilin peptidase 1 [Permianibacter aggregans]